MFKYSQLNEDKYDVLSIKSECKFTVGLYNYTCLLHYISKCLIEQYIDRLYEDKKVITGKEHVSDHDTLIHMALRLLESMKKIREHKDFINYYDIWLFKPRFKDTDNDAEVNAEYHVYQDIISNSNVTKECITKIHEEAYWFMISSTRGLAMSLYDKDIRCQFTNEFSYEIYLVNNLDNIISRLRDRYIEQTLIPVLKDSKGSLVIHLLYSDLHHIKPEVITNSTLVRRYIYTVNPIVKLCTSSTVIGIEHRHFECIKVYRLIESCEVEVEDGDSIGYSIIIDVKKKDKGMCFAVIEPSEIPKDTKVLKEAIKKIKKILMKCISHHSS